jgi:hypothetical protein
VLTHLNQIIQYKTNSQTFNKLKICWI